MSTLILLIDDDADEAVIFSTAIQMAGVDCDCVHAESATDALDILDRVTPAYIFMDINMPKISGLTCLAKIRQQPRLNSVPVIVYSTGADADMQQKATSLGANGCLKKEGSLATQAAAMKRVFKTI